MRSRGWCNEGRTVLNIVVLLQNIHMTFSRVASQLLNVTWSYLRSRLETPKKKKSVFKKQLRPKKKDQPDSQTLRLIKTGSPLFTYNKRLSLQFTSVVKFQGNDRHNSLFPVVPLLARSRAQYSKNT